MNIKLYPPLAIHELGQRGNQEDTIFPARGKATPEDCLFVVCDGMGGHEHGEVASETFATALARFFEGRVSPDVVLTDQTLADAIEAAYLQLDAVDDGNFKKMGTTLTLVYFHRGGVTAAHIGDSRIYHIRPGVGPLYVSRDHSLAYDLYLSGEISFDEIKTFPQKSVLSRVVQPGEDNRVRPDVIHITDVEPGDYFYLCSDGMLEQMDDEELVKLLSTADSDEQKLKQLIAATADNQDNHSAYLIHVKEVKREKNDALIADNEEKTARCNALNIMPAAEAPTDLAAAEERDRELLAPETATVKSKRWLWWLVLLALLAAAAIAFFGMRGQSEPAPSRPADTVTRVKPIRPIHPIEQPASPEDSGHEPSDISNQ